MSTGTTADKLLKMKDKIESAKSNIARLEGSKDQLYKTLLSEHGCKTLKEAEKKLADMSKDLDIKEAALEEGVKSLEEQYDWA